MNIEQIAQLKNGYTHGFDFFFTSKPNRAQRRVCEKIVKSLTPVSIKSICIKESTSPVQKMNCLTIMLSKGVKDSYSYMMKMCNIHTELYNTLAEYNGWEIYNTNEPVYNNEWEKTTDIKIIWVKK